MLKFFSKRIIEELSNLVFLKTDKLLIFNSDIVDC